MMKLNLVAAAVMLAVAGPAFSQTATTLSPGTNVVGVPGCHFGEQIDGTTADQAAKHAQAAGYTPSAASRNPATTTGTARRC